MEIVAIFLCATALTLIVIHELLLRTDAFKWILPLFMSGGELRNIKLLFFHLTRRYGKFSRLDARLLTRGFLNELACSSSPKRLAHTLRIAEFIATFGSRGQKRIFARSVENQIRSYVQGYDPAFVDVVLARFIEMGLVVKPEKQVVLAIAEQKRWHSSANRFFDSDSLAEGRKRVAAKRQRLVASGRLRPN